MPPGAFTQLRPGLLQPRGAPAQGSPLDPELWGAGGHLAWLTLQPPAVSVGDSALTVKGLTSPALSHDPPPLLALPSQTPALQAVCPALGFFNLPGEACQRMGHLGAGTHGPHFQAGEGG